MGGLRKMYDRDDFADDGSELFHLHGEPLPEGWHEVDLLDWETEDRLWRLRAKQDKQKYGHGGFCSKCARRSGLAHCGKCEAELCDGCQQKLHGGLAGKPCVHKLRQAEAA